MNKTTQARGTKYPSLSIIRKWQLGTGIFGALTTAFLLFPLPDPLLSRLLTKYEQVNYDLFITAIVITRPAEHLLNLMNVTGHPEIVFAITLVLDTVVCICVGTGIGFLIKRYRGS